MRIGGDGDTNIGADGPDIDAFVNCFEQPRERSGPSFHERSLVIPGGRLGRRRHHGGGRHELLLDGGADIPDRGAGRVHLTRACRHVDADGAFHAVFLPFHDISVGRARSHEAVVVAAMATTLAAAEAGNVAQNLGMLGGKLVGGRHDGWRTRGLVASKRDGRKPRLLVRPEGRSGPGSRLGLRRH